MGKNNRDSKDRMYMSNQELQSCKRPEAIRGSYRRLPFDHCALSLVPFESPCCGPEGVIFDLLTIMPYLQKYKKNPITGEPMTSRDITRLNMTKNSKGEWHCPVTFKPFNDASHVVAIKTSGNVYSFEAISELNIKAKNWEDLMTGEAFTKKDIVTLQDSQNEQHMAARDISNFVHLKQVREDSHQSESAQSSVRHNPTAENVMKEIARIKESEAQSGVSKRALEEIFGGTVGSIDQSEKDDGGEDVQELMRMGITTEEADGSILTDSRKSGAFTSSSFGSIVTSSSTRLARPSELREARFRKMRDLKQKAVVQLQTNMGQLNLEIACDIAPRSSWNFLALCGKGYYDNNKFHRLVPGFTLQGGSDSGTGKGGASAFHRGKMFADEFDQRLKHNARGVLSMANSGPNCNKSQFFITLGECAYLDNKHSVFGMLVGGASTLDRIEALGADDREWPTADVIIMKAIVVSSPVDAADAMLINEINAKRAKGTCSAPPPVVEVLKDPPVEAALDMNKYIAHQATLSMLSSSSYAEDAKDSSHDSQQAKKFKGGGFGDFAGW